MPGSVVKKTQNNKSKDSKDVDFGVEVNFKVIFDKKTNPNLSRLGFAYC